MPALAAVAVLLHMTTLPTLAAESVVADPDARLDGSAAAVQQEPSGNEDSSRIVYGPEFFAEYNVTTAEDILRRIPGVAAMLDGSNSTGQEGQRRGFGSSGDQILINGRRLAGKSNEITAALQRIQVQNLARVELLRGTSSDVDVRSDGVIVNVILKEGEATASSGSAKLAAQINESEFSDFDGAVNYNGELGRLSYFVSLEKNSVSTDQRSGWTTRYRDEQYFYATGELMENRDAKADREMTEYTFAANSTYSFENGDRLQLNALFKPSTSTEVDKSAFTEFDIDGTPGISGVDRRSRETDPEDEWEFGGTYERGLSDESSLKILTLYNHRDTGTIEARDALFGDQVFEVIRNLSDVAQTEAIARGSYYRPLTSSQTIEIGGEIARNTLEQGIDVFFDQNGDGIAERIEIFNPSSKVEEVRSELFVNHNWTLTDRWTASSSLVAENSEITQSGADLNNSTSFDFIKPRVDIRFAPNPVDQLRLKVERTVSQLDFSNFVPQYDIRNDRFTAGNPDLRPETAWEYEVGFEHRLPDDQGVIEARLFYNDIQDRIESVAIDVDGDGELDPASGNIGDASEYGGELSFSIRMARLGVPDLILDGSYLRRKSEVTDPFTGLHRKMATQEDYLAELGIRHDVSDWNLSYGANYTHSGGTNIRSEWREYRYFSRKPEITAFLEKRFNTRWTLRLDALSLTLNGRSRNRLVFADNATAGTIDRREFYNETRGRRYTMSVTATF